MGYSEGGGVLQDRCVKKSGTSAGHSMVRPADVPLFFTQRSCRTPPPSFRVVATTILHPHHHNKPPPFFFIVQQSTNNRWTSLSCIAKIQQSTWVFWRRDQSGRCQSLLFLFKVTTASEFSLSDGSSILESLRFFVTSASNGLYDRSNNSSFDPESIGEEEDGGWQLLSILFRAETASGLSFRLGCRLQSLHFRITWPTDGLFCFTDGSF
jgi:hypothetical protein